MKKLQKYHYGCFRRWEFFAGALIAVSLAFVPVSAQAEVLQSTFGKGYDFLNNESSIQSVQTGTSIKVQDDGTFKPTFGEGYAFLEKDSLAPTVLTKGTVVSPKEKIFAETAPKPSRTSAFTSLFGEGYGAVIKTD